MTSKNRKWPGKTNFDVSLLKYLSDRNRTFTTLILHIGLHSDKVWKILNFLILHVLSDYYRQTLLIKHLKWTHIFAAGLHAHIILQCSLKCTYVGWRQMFPIHFLSCMQFHLHIIFPQLHKESVSNTPYRKSFSVWRFVWSIVQKVRGILLCGLEQKIQGKCEALPIRHRRVRIISCTIKIKLITSGN
jgi:hypothetical protein